MIGTGRRVLAIAAAVALLALSLGVGVASAGGRDASTAHNTFTKWMAGYPNMAGIVGGDVGPGTYSGEIITMSGTGTAADPLLITADYHFHGSRHDFTARVDIVEVVPTGTISGVVTDGWLAGNLAEGEFNVITCDHAGTISPPTNCFQGYLDVLRGTKSDE